jgi:hypothetical protein
MLAVGSQLLQGFELRQGGSWAAAACQRPHAGGSPMRMQTFIKIGQQFSTRVDVLAPEFIKELESLQVRRRPSRGGTFSIFYLLS